MSIDQFIDVDFTKDSHYVMGDLGPGDLSGYANYEDSVQLIPESQWRDLAEAMAASGGGADKYVTRIYNQRSEGSCVANACSQAHEVAQMKTFGQVVHLSAISLYKRIGSSPGSGAMVSDGLSEMQRRGVLPLDNDENKAKFGQHVMPNTGWSTRFPDGWEETAKRFRAVEATIIRNVNELFTACLRQDPVVVGRSGHSICYLTPIWRDGRWVFKYANSWGDWGDSGYGYDSASLYQSSARWAFALRVVTDPGYSMGE